MAACISRRLLTVALAIASAAVAAPVMLHFQVEPQSEMCVHEDVNSGVEVQAYAMVYRGGKLDIKLRVEGPDQRVVYENLLFSNINDEDGSMLPTIVRKGSTFTAPTTGTYTFCLDNRMARWTAKVLTFELDVQRPAFEYPTPTSVPMPDAGASAALAAAGSTLRDTARRVHAKMMMIESAQYYHYHREQRHRETLESTDKRVVWWSIASACVVTVTSGVMSVIVRRWFAQPSLPGARP